MLAGVCARAGERSLGRALGRQPSSLRPPAGSAWPRLTSALSGEALQARVGELETELRAAGTDAAVLAARLRESERAVAEARAEAAASFAASAGWERLAIERGAAVEQLQQARGPFLCITRPEWSNRKRLFFISSTSRSVWCCLVDRSAGWEHLAAKCGIATCSCSAHSEVVAKYSVEP